MSTRKPFLYRVHAEDSIGTRYRGDALPIEVAVMAMIQILVIWPNDPVWIEPEPDREA